MKEGNKIYLVITLFCIACAALCVVIMLTSGCDVLTKSEDQTVNYVQTVIYDAAGTPVQVLSADGTTYVSVSEASNELLIQRGLIRINGKVTSQ